MFFGSNNLQQNGIYRRSVLFGRKARSYDVKSQVSRLKVASAEWAPCFSAEKHGATM